MFGDLDYDPSCAYQAGTCAAVLCSCTVQLSMGWLYCGQQAAWAQRIRFAGQQYWPWEQNCGESAQSDDVQKRAVFSNSHLVCPQATPLEEQLEALSRAVDAGKVRHVGVSNETPWGLMKALAAGGDEQARRMRSCCPTPVCSCCNTERRPAPWVHSQPAGAVIAATV